MSFRDFLAWGIKPLRNWRFWAPTLGTVVLLPLLGIPPDISFLLGMLSGMAAALWAVAHAIEQEL